MTDLRKVIILCEGTSYKYPDEREGRGKLKSNVTLREIMNLLSNLNENISQNEAFAIYGLEYRSNKFDTKLEDLYRLNDKEFTSAFQISVTSPNDAGLFKVKTNNYLIFL